MMNQTRRSFLINTSLALSGTFILPQSVLAKPKHKRFLSRIGVCTSITNNKLLAGCGYSYIEENVQKFLVPEKSEAEFNEILNAANNSKIPVPICCSFLPGSMKSVGPDAVHDKIMAYAETAFRRAKISGVKIIVFGSGRSRAIPDGFSREEARQQFVKLCGQLGYLAARFDVTLAIEPLNKKECNFINSLAEGGEIVKDINHPNVLLIADIYRMKTEDEQPDAILKYGHLITHTHIAEKEGRTPPGVHGEDFCPYFEALKKIRYKGMISIECQWENIDSQALIAINIIKNQI